MRNRWMFRVGFFACKVLQHASATSIQSSSAAQHVKLTSDTCKNCPKSVGANISQFVCG
jgi:hypothetical protein